MFRSDVNPMFRSKFSEDIFKAKYLHEECETWEKLAKARKAQPPQLGHFQQGLFARLRDRFLG